MIQNKMDFSMYINRIFGYITAILTLAGCSGITDTGTDWFADYDTMITGTPRHMQYGRPSDGYGTSDASGDAHNMAVLLPLSGDNATIGQTIRTSIETAVLQSAPQNLSVSFYDSSTSLPETIKSILATDSDIIIGPVFSDNVRILRDSKPTDLPVISFTSDASAVGNGVMTMALMPTNSIEAIIREMTSDEVKQFIILAPNTPSGRMMSGAAKQVAENYELPLVGLFYYTEQDSESIKDAARTAAMNTARTAAHTRARQVLSDILTNETLTPAEETSLNLQLEKLEKTETLGHVPYDAVLFLGNGDDTKSLASFLRYYDVSARDARFYGTTMWDGSDITGDFTMSGAKFATLPNINQNFASLYEQVSGTQPNRLATFGYDAANMAIGMIYSNKSNAAYLLDPSGYMGTDGLFRLKPNGTSERSLRIVQLDGSGTPREIKSAQTNFIKPIYGLTPDNIESADAFGLETPGIDPDDYIRIPAHLSDKYRSKTIGAHITKKSNATPSQVVAIISTDDTTTITSTEYQPTKLETVKRSYIEEYEVEE